MLGGGLENQIDELAVATLHQRGWWGEKKEMGRRMAGRCKYHECLKDVHFQLCVVLHELSLALVRCDGTAFDPEG